MGGVELKNFLLNITNFLELNFCKQSSWGPKMTQKHVTEKCIQSVGRSYPPAHLTSWRHGHTPQPISHHGGMVIPPQPISHHGGTVIPPSPSHIMEAFSIYHPEIILAEKNYQEKKHMRNALIFNLL